MFPLDVRPDRALQPDYGLFLDESGDPTMMYAGREPPVPPEVFLLCGCMFGRAAYEQVRADLRDFKERHLGRTDVPLVSRQLRKHKGAFAFLDDPDKERSFQQDIAALIQKAEFTAFAAGIDKYRHWLQYGSRATSPYDLGLTFILERVALCPARENTKVQVIAESRGSREDNALRLAFSRLLQTGSYVSGERLRACFLPNLKFLAKRQNIAGLQIADLVAYPLANRICHPTSRRKDFAVVETKLYRSDRGAWGMGLKVFPRANRTDYGL
jgi:hypothetical protein